jgi:hypothetical protein
MAALYTKATDRRRLAAFGDGGEGRTRTFEAMRRLIYSQLPLPLGTLPLNSIENPPANWRKQGHG